MVKTHCITSHSLNNTFNKSKPNHPKSLAMKKQNFEFSKTPKTKTFIPNSPPLRLPSPLKSMPRLLPPHPHHRLSMPIPRHPIQPCAPKTIARRHIRIAPHIAAAVVRAPKAVFSAFPVAGEEFHWFCFCFCFRGSTGCDVEVVVAVVDAAWESGG